MSFSSNIKEELSRNETSARHCKIAEIAGFLKFGGDISLEPDNYTIQIQTETVSAAKDVYKRQLQYSLVLQKYLLVLQCGMLCVSSLVHCLKYISLV